MRLYSVSPSAKDIILLVKSHVIRLRSTWCVSNIWIRELSSRLVHGRLWSTVGCLLVANGKGAESQKSALSHDRPKNIVRFWLNICLLFWCVSKASFCLFQSHVPGLLPFPPCPLYCNLESSGACVDRPRGRMIPVGSILPIFQTENFKRRYMNQVSVRWTDCKQRRRECRAHVDTHIDPWNQPASLKFDRNWPQNKLAKWAHCTLIS